MNFTCSFLKMQLLENVNDIVACILSYWTYGSTSGIVLRWLRAKRLSSMFVTVGVFSHLLHSPTSCVMRSPSSQPSCTPCIFLPPSPSWERLGKTLLLHLHLQAQPKAEGQCDIQQVLTHWPLNNLPHSSLTMKPCQKPTLSLTVAHGILTLDRLIKSHKKSGRLKLRKDHLARVKHGDRTQATSLADSSFTLVCIYCEHKLLPLSLILGKCLSSFFHSELISE